MYITIVHTASASHWFRLLSGYTLMQNPPGLAGSNFCKSPDGVAGYNTNIADFSTEFHQTYRNNIVSFLKQTGMKMLETGGLLGEIDQLTVDAAAGCCSVLIYSPGLLSILVVALFVCCTCIQRVCRAKTKTQ